MKGQPERSRRHASAPEPREGNYWVVAGRGSEQTVGGPHFCLKWEAPRARQMADDFHEGEAHNWGRDPVVGSEP